jgi:hypothetical protein
MDATVGYNVLDEPLPAVEELAGYNYLLSTPESLLPRTWTLNPILHTQPDLLSPPAAIGVLVSKKSSTRKSTQP